MLSLMNNYIIILYNWKEIFLLTVLDLSIRLDNFVVGLDNDYKLI